VEIRKLLLDAGKELVDTRVKAAVVNDKNEASKV
jgi:hypothetical protein